MTTTQPSVPFPSEAPPPPVQSVRKRTDWTNPAKYAVRPWIYDSRTGELFHYETGSLEDKGYSGKGVALNNPEMEKVKGMGPIPRGLYMIGNPRFSERTGRYVLDLTPLGHTALGRSGLQIHGDNAQGSMNASSGCIVLGNKTRVKISEGSPLILVRAD